jgi:choline transport protein
MQMLIMMTAPDYCVAAFGIVLVISVLQWIIDGRKNFTGPRISLDDLAQGVPVGEVPTNEEYSEEEKVTK